VLENVFKFFSAFGALRKRLPLLISSIPNGRTTVQRIDANIIVSSIDKIKFVSAKLIQLASHSAEALYFTENIKLNLKSMFR
jgi:hypothetical protein